MDFILTESKVVNIRDLGIDIPSRREDGFNPKKEIFSYDWQGMQDALEVYRRSNRTASLLTFAVNMKILDPEKDPSANFDQRNWDSIFSLIDQNRRNTRWGTVAEKAVLLKILSPTQFGNILPSINSWADYRHFFDMLFDSAPTPKAHVLYDLKLLSPTAFGELALTSGTQSILVSSIQQERTKAANRGLGAFLVLLVKSGVLFAGNSPLPSLNQDEWMTLKTRLRNYRRQEDWSNFASLASNLTLLSIPPLKITDTEILIPKFSDHFQDPLVTLPQVRKF